MTGAIGGRSVRTVADRYAAAAVHLFDEGANATACGRTNVVRVTTMLIDVTCGHCWRSVRRRARFRRDVKSGQI